MSRKNTLLMYSHDGFGLGHIRRNINIATEAVQQIDLAVLMLMSHNSIPFLPNLAGIDFIKLPSILKTGKDCWTPRTLPMPPQQFKELRIDLIQKTIEHFQPSIFLVDYLPGGVWGELLPILPALKKRGTKLILGLRDILDDPDETCKAWKKEGLYSVIEQFYDHILIYGSRDVFPSHIVYGLQKFENKIFYTGYLASADIVRSREQIRKEFGFDERPLVVITAGGGSDAYPMMRKSLKALEKIAKKTEVQALFVAGPLMNAMQREALESDLATLPFRIIPHSDDLLSAMKAADLLLTMGSYNTIIEAIRLGIGAIVIPREGPSQEQKIRADLFGKLGLVSPLPSPAKLSVDRLANEIEKLLKNPFTPRLGLNFNGRNEAVHYIKLLLENETHTAHCALHT